MTPSGRAPLDGFCGCGHIPLVESAPRHLLLHCDLNESIFTLTAVRENWRFFFGSLDNALVVAAARVVEETPFSIYDHLGREIIETTVSPCGFEEF